MPTDGSAVVRLRTRSKWFQGQTDRGDICACGELVSLEMDLILRIEHGLAM